MPTASEHPSLRTLQAGSDRLSLTVRLCRDGTREWLSTSGSIALVFFERGHWWSRASATSGRTQHDSEMEALDALLAEPLLTLRLSTRGW